MLQQEPNDSPRCLKCNQAAPTRHQKGRRPTVPDGRRVDAPSRALWAFGMVLSARDGVASGGNAAHLFSGYDLQCTRDSDFRVIKSYREG